MRSPLLCGLLLTALTATRADAQGESPGLQRVAVVRLDFQGGVPEAVRSRFAHRVVEGLAAARFEVLAGDGLQRRLQSSGARPCAEPSCYPDFARSLGVGYLVSGRIAEQDKTYDIKLDLINGRTGAILASVHERCETCGLEDAAEKVNLASSALRTRLEAVTRSPARFVIRSRPESAQAQLDGKPVGSTPLDLELSSGEHQLSLRAPDHEPLHRSFVVVSGVDETLDLELLRTPTNFPYRTIGWTGLTVGALAIAGGVFALAVDGKQIDCPKSKQDREGHCPRIRSTGVLGAVLLGVGSASAAVGGISLYLGSDSTTTETAGREFGIALNGKF
jgi:predicted Zn-ribbon and HTH transcriptional regulator